MSELPPCYYQTIEAGDGVSVNTAAFEERARDFLARHGDQLRRLYEEKLGVTHEEDAVIITLADVPPDQRRERTIQFEAKIKEYEKRIRKKIINAEGGFSIIHNLFKRDALKLLLEYGSLNTFAFSRAEAEALGVEKLGRRLGVRFESACGVIESYVRTGKARGGTGLLEIKK